MENYQAVFKRKELKYLLTEAQLAALRPVLFSHTVPDAFAHSSILNLYYDTPDFRMIRRSQEKPAYKEKLRLRSYGVPQEQTPVFPEIKKKAEGIVYKRRVGMPCRDAVLYLSRQCPGGDDQIFRELDWMLSSYGSLAPRKTAAPRLLKQTAFGSEGLPPFSSGLFSSCVPLTIYRKAAPPPAP